MTLNDIQVRVRAVLEYRDLRSLPRWKRPLIGALRIAWGIGREVTEGQLTLRAMSLVYTTLLSMVPLLALSFSVLKAFGAHNQLEPLLLSLLEPLGPQGVEVAENVIGFVDNMRVGVLGFIGLIFLIYTVIALVQKIESAFNYTWRINGTRSLAQRFSNYLSVILVGPVLVVSALGITASIMATSVMQQAMEVQLLGDAVQLAGRMVPYLLIIGAFMFVYVFVPNTRVKLFPALVGAVVAGLLWQSTGWIFAAMMAGSTRYAAIYSSFAIMIMLLIWMYLSWLILLIGANVAFFVQYPEYMLVRRGQVQLSSALKERLALRVMKSIGTRFHEGRGPTPLDDLAHELDMPVEAVERVTDALRKAGLLVTAGQDPVSFVPGRDTGQITLKACLDAVRGADSTVPGPRGEDEPVDTLMEALDRALGERLEGLTLATLIEGREK
ncbi:YhjD/YihY/BrkB family envelope integrity protein [Thioalkalivibrio sulfidiphilus]|uniref:YhjD/YihY/BrkB family envelope integrity protein n=1 Tax=Thioalkalivibrio sulfidiphilus TaxID=1033854 RepID=UPI00035DEE82|nr:YhjD/YihY/BrkB family envelope integrity protein [Thioalkalivibrio sulfidiphilus]